MKRIRFILLSILLIFTEFFILPAFANDSYSTVEAATLKINKTFLNLDVGKTFTLKITDTKSKIKWSSSNKKIATVNSGGKVTAVAEGTAIITGKVSSRKYTCRVTVKNTISNKEATNNLFYEEAETESGFVAIIENKNKVSVYNHTEVSFYDDNDKLLSTEESYVFLSSGQKYVASFPYPMDSFGSLMEYASYQLKVEAEVVPYSNSYIEDIDVRSEGTFEGIAADITNKSDENIDIITIAAVFYRNGNIVGYSSGNVSNLSGGCSTNITINKPINTSDFSQTIIYDNYELYVNEAYTKQNN